jgi:hypothetical protein
MRLIMVIALSVLATMQGTLPGHADKRVALVIGNAAYRNLPQLLNPKNDAADVNASLRGPSSRPTSIAAE